MAVMAFYGFSIGCNMGLYNIVIMEVMGVEHLAPVFGTTCLFVAIGFLCTGPFIGMHTGFRDRHTCYTQPKSPTHHRLKGCHQFTGSKINECHLPPPSAFIPISLLSYSPTRS